VAFRELNANTLGASAPKFFWGKHYGQKDLPDTVVKLQKALKEKPESRQRLACFSFDKIPTEKRLENALFYSFRSGLTPILDLRPIDVVCDRVFYRFERLISCESFGSPSFTPNILIKTNSSTLDLPRWLRPVTYSEKSYRKLVEEGFFPIPREALTKKVSDGLTGCFTTDYLSKKHKKSALYILPTSKKLGKDNLRGNVILY
jgi:hypothetical protein